MDHSIWAQQVQSLAPHYRVIAPDLRGFGRSSVTPGKVTVEQWADDLAAMLDALKISEPIVLGGLSMGGYVAFRFFRGASVAAGRADSLRHEGRGRHPQAAAGRLETAQRVEREGDPVPGRHDVAPPPGPCHAGGQAGSGRSLAADHSCRRPGRLRCHVAGPGRAAGLHPAAAADRLPHAADRGTARRDFHCRRK